MTGRTRVALHGGLATLAASSALIAVFDGLAWVPPVALAIAVVVLAGELVRRTPIPAALGPLLAGGGVLCLLTRLYASENAWLHVFPTKTSLHDLGVVVRDGFDDVRKLAPPVPPHDGVVLLAVVGVAAVALVVDLLAVTLRRAALAGLPLLAVFATGTSIAKHGASWLAFVLASIGYLWLLLADSRDRLSRWGRSLGFDQAARPKFTWSDEEVMPSPLSVMGRRIGFAAIAVGVILPMLVPGLHGGVPHGGGHGLGFGRGGSSTAVTLNPIVTIRAQLTSAKSQRLMVVHTDDPDPGYLRLTALDQFDGATFSPSTLEQPVEAQVSRGIAAPLVRGRAVNVKVSVEDLAVRWLPLPVQVSSVHVPGDWRYDPRTNTVFSARSDTQDIEYDAHVTRPTPTPADLEQAAAPDTAFSRYLQLPPLPQDVKHLTETVTATAPTMFEKAVAIQKFLTSGKFGYDTSVPASNSTETLSDFLLHSRRGFCQQYATAMAVMARYLGIPARVAVGFTRGTQQPDGSWVVTTHDAHAWPELYFTGYGWLAFEPTPRDDGQARAPAYTVMAASSGKGPNGQATGPNANGKGGTPGGGKPKNQRFDDNSDRQQGAGATPGAAAPGGSPRHWRGTAVLVLLALFGLMLIVPVIARYVTRRRRWARARTGAERAAAAWAELRATAIDARINWVDGLSPRATARLLRTEAAGFATAEIRALDQIVDAVQRALYAPDRTPMHSWELQDDVEQIRGALFSEATVGERFVLRAWPRSTLRDARELSGRFGDLLDIIDLRLAQLRARLRPRAAHS